MSLSSIFSLIESIFILTYIEKSKKLVYRFLFFSTLTKIELLETVAYKFIDLDLFILAKSKRDDKCI